MKTVFGGLMASFLILILAPIAMASWGMGSDKKVLLKDVEVLTLYHGKMTQGRRSSPVPQLDCTEGGTAPCSSFKPKVVQCINKGNDGYDVQWECKSDMDNAYRFGQIEVSCEGYDYPEDPYILHGSCGLKYSLDYTKEGQHQSRSHDYYGNGYNDHQTHGKPKQSSSSIIADLIVYVAGGLLIYAFYKTCIVNSRGHDSQHTYSSTNDDYPPGGDNRGGGGGYGNRGGGGGYGWFGGNANPPPNTYSDNASCGNRNSTSSGGGGGGFWTGLATGGLMGYMFGGQNRRNYWGGGNAYAPGYGSGYGGRSTGGGFFSSSASSSSGTRSASGFGGTSRR